MVKISFPGLGIGEISINKVAFTIPIGEGIQIRWYALILVTGIILAFCYANFRRKQEGISFDDLLDYALFAVPCGVIGARLFYVIMSDRDYTFWEIFRIWEGGIAIYGAVIGGALALIGVSLYKKIKCQKAFDMVCLGVLIGQVVGRWGNFVNAEAYGIPPAEDSFFYRFRMEILEEGWSMAKTVQPTFLYESVWNLIGFIIINFFYKKKKYDGQIFLMYITWYGLGRVFIEGLRTDSLWAGKFRASQVIAGLCFIAGTVLLTYFGIRARKRARIAAAANDAPSAYSTILSETIGEKTEDAKPVEAASEEDKDGNTAPEEENKDVGNTD